MSTVQVQLPFENLLDSLPQLTVEQLEVIVQKAAVMQAQRRSPHLESAEAELLKQIHEQVISDEIKTRCAQLTQMQRDESLSQAEQQELAELIDKMELINAQRVALMVNLAQIRGISLEKLAQKLELSPLSYD